MKKLKKLLAMTLAMVMALALSVPAFAADPVEESQQTSYEVYLDGAFYAPIIRVQVADTGLVYVNPAKGIVAGEIEGFLDGTSNLKYQIGGQKSLVSTPIAVRSDTAMDMSIQVTAVANSETITFINSGTPATDEKEATLKLYGNYTAPSAGPLPTGSKSADDLDPDNGGITDTMFATISNGNFKVDDTNDHLATVKDVKAGFVAAADVTETNGEITKVEPQYGFVGVEGTISALDPEEDIAWTEEDVVSVSFTLTFVIENVVND